MKSYCGIILAVVLSIAIIAAALADPMPAAGVPMEDDMKAFALQRFAQMQAGRIDRTQYAAAYGAQLTDDARPLPIRSVQSSNRNQEKNQEPRKAFHVLRLQGDIRILIN